MPIRAKESKILSWGTESKALLMSKNTALTCQLEERSWCQVLVTDNNASWVEEPRLKPN